MNSSAVILQEIGQIANLLTRFSSNRPLTLTARSIRDELILRNGNGLAARQQHERTLAISGVTVSMSERNVTAFNAGNLVAAAQHNLDLSKELTYAGDDLSRPAQSVFIDLARSVEQMGAAASGIAAAYQSASVSSSHIPANSP